MRLLSIGAYIVTLLGGFAVSQNSSFIDLIPTLPGCITKCSLVQMSIANCQLSDVRNCLCTNVTLQIDLATCVQDTCNFTEQSIASSFLQNEVCDGVPQPSVRNKIIYIIALMSAITFPTVILRCVSRLTLAHRFYVDDWLAIMSLAVMISASIIIIYITRLGFGRHFYDVPPDNVVLIWKFYYYCQFAYVVGQGSTRCCILTFFLRVFPAPRFQLLTKIFIVYTTARYVGYLFAVAFQCTPVAFIWDASLHGTCINNEATIYSGSAFSLIEDVLIIALPTSQLKSLNLSLKKRIALIFMFALGSFACVTTMVRLKYIVKYGNSTDVSWDEVDVVLWSIIETYSALICACLVSIWPMLARIGLKLKAWVLRTPTTEEGKIKFGRSWHTKRAKRPKLKSSTFGTSLNTTLFNDEDAIMGSCTDRKEVSQTVSQLGAIDLEDGNHNQSIELQEGIDAHSLELSSGGRTCSNKVDERNFVPLYTYDKRCTI